MQLGKRLEKKERKRLGMPQNSCNAQAPASTPQTAKARLAATRRGSPCGMAPKKGRKRAAEALKEEIDASYMMMARASGESLFKTLRDFNEILDRETPYGRILKYTDLQRDDNSYFTLAYACPFALFFCLCEESPYFFPLLLTCWGLVTTASLVF